MNFTEEEIAALQAVRTLTEDGRTNYKSPAWALARRLAEEKGGHFPEVVWVDPDGRPNIEEASMELYRQLLLI